MDWQWIIRTLQYTGWGISFWIWRHANLTNLASWYILLLRLLEVDCAGEIEAWGERQITTENGKTFNSETAGKYSFSWSNHLVDAVPATGRRKCYLVPRRIWTLSIATAHWLLVWCRNQWGSHGQLFSRVHMFNNWFSLESMKKAKEGNERLHLLGDPPSDR